MNPVILCILDGIGISNKIKGNAFKQAQTPNFDYLWNNHPHSLLIASGENVGLPSNQMGNSEVGHINIGAGRIVMQPLTIINKSIEDKTFFNKESFLNIINHVKNNDSKLHVFGLASDGGVHSMLDHIIEVLEIVNQNEINKLYIHIITDGRDTLPKSAYTYVKQLEDKLKELQIGTIATIAGRYYTMDRDNKWERTKKAYDAIVWGNGNYGTTPKEVIENSYKQNITDEFILPTIINKDGLIEDGDGIIVANYRPDRLIQLFSSITNSEFDCFDRKQFNNIKLVTLFPTSNKVVGESVFEKQDLKNTLGEYLSGFSIKQLRIAETEKYAHVTYFFDGGTNRKINNCNRILIPSSKVATYDLKPEMGADEITNRLLEELDKDYDFVVLNYANGDMVGHTGNMKAAIKAIETVDINLGRLYHKIKQLNGTLIITADHGNCEEMLNEKGNILTSHSNNPVPFIITNKGYVLKDGKLSDIAPTILKIMNIKIPEEMTGEVLIK
ncbi:MAG: 2,3-bisphosphoglycerate-independent phosphoglycerate mutase [Bacilli bacterium]